LIDKLGLYTKALSLRKELGEDDVSPVDIFALAHTIDKLTLVFYAMGENLSGMCIKNDGKPVIAINSAMSLGRQRFSLAHELYHLYFDEAKELTACAKKIGAGNENEKAADQFASYFLMPALALSDSIKKMKENENAKLGITEIVKLEQYFGVSRQALLYRLIDDKKLTSREAERFKKGVIASAISLGFDDCLYRSLPEARQYRTYGYYIKKAEELLEKDLVSMGKYEQLLLSAFRPDLIYGDDAEGEELND